MQPVIKHCCMTVRIIREYLSIIVSNLSNLPDLAARVFRVNDYMFVVHACTYTYVHTINTIGRHDFSNIVTTCLNGT